MRVVVLGRRGAAIADPAEAVRALRGPTEVVDGLFLRYPFGDLSDVGGDVPQQPVDELAVRRVGVVDDQRERRRLVRDGVDRERR